MNAEEQEKFSGQLQDLIERIRLWWVESRQCDCFDGIVSVYAGTIYCTGTDRDETERAISMALLYSPDWKEQVQAEIEMERKAQEEREARERRAVELRREAEEKMLYRRLKEKYGKEEG